MTRQKEKMFFRKGLFTFLCIMHNYNLCILLWIGHFSCSMHRHDCEHCAFSQFTCKDEFRAEHLLHQC